MSAVCSMTLPQTAQLQPRPQHCSQPCGQPSETVGPLAQERAETQQQLHQPRWSDLPSRHAGVVSENLCQRGGCLRSWTKTLMFQRQRCKSAKVWALSSRQLVRRTIFPRWPFGSTSATTRHNREQIGLAQWRAGQFKRSIVQDLVEVTALQSACERAFLPDGVGGREVPRADRRTGKGIAGLRVPVDGAYPLGEPMVGNEVTALVQDCETAVRWLVVGMFVHGLPCDRSCCLQPTLFFPSELQ